MYGFPHYFATKEDYYNIVTLYPEETKEALKKLLEERYSWQIVSVLDSYENGIIDDTHKVQEMFNGNESVFYQLEYKLSEENRYDSIGWTEEESNAFFEKY